MAFIGNIIKGVAKIAKKVGGTAIEAIKRGISNRKEKRAARKALDPLTTTTDELVEGTGKYYRNLINEQKDKARAIDKKMRAFKKLVNAGATEAEARATLGLTEAEMNTPASFFIGNAGEQEEYQPEPEKKQVYAAGKGCLVTSIILLSSIPFLTVIIIILIKLI